MIRYWLVAYSAPSHYLNQYWHIVNLTPRNHFSEIRIEIQNSSFMKMHLKCRLLNWRPFCPGGRWVISSNNDQVHWPGLNELMGTHPHYNDVIMGAIPSQITSPTIVYSNVYLDADQRKHQSSVSLAFVRGIHRWPVNSPHKWPVTRKMFPFDDVIIREFKSQSCVILNISMGERQSVVPNI